jgi:hypothetical protein
MRYKTVAFHADIRKKDGAAGVARELEAVLNAHAEQGWEYVGMTTLTYSVGAGCLASFLGAKAQIGQLDAVVFKRDQ